MIDFTINKEYRNKISTFFFEEKILEIFNFLKIDPHSDLSVFFGSDYQLKKLNKQYRGINEPTDVLSFDSFGVNPDSGFKHLGDIAISLQTAEKQAKEAGHPVENELILLLVHSILHLIGFDHNNKIEKEVMWKKQCEILEHLEIEIYRISGDENFHD